jgi:hypothetical protein
MSTDSYQQFGGVYYLYLQGQAVQGTVITFLWNTGNYLPVDIA